MPAKTVARSRKSSKVGHVGSSRREAKAVSKPSRSASRSAARGLAHNRNTVRRDSGIHAKKDTAGSLEEKSGKVAVSTPNVLGSSNRVDEAKYTAMRDILLKVLPRKAP